MNDPRNPYASPAVSVKAPPDSVEHATGRIGTGLGVLLATVVVAGVLWTAFPSNPWGGVLAIGLAAAINCTAVLQTRSFTRFVVASTKIVTPAAVTCIFAVLVWEVSVVPAKQWFDWWFAIFIANLISGLLALATLVLPPYHPKYVAAWSVPVATINLVFWGINMAGVFMPNP